MLEERNGKAVGPQSYKVKNHTIKYQKKVLNKGAEIGTSVRESQKDNEDRLVPLF